MPDSPLDFIGLDETADEEPPEEPKEHTPPSTPPQSEAWSSHSPQTLPRTPAALLGHKTMALWRNVSRGASRWLFRSRPADDDDEAQLRV